MTLLKRFLNGLLRKRGQRTSGQPISPIRPLEKFPRKKVIGCQYSTDAGERGTIAEARIVRNEKAILFRDEEGYYFSFPLDGKWYEEQGEITIWAWMPISSGCCGKGCSIYLV